MFVVLGNNKKLLIILLSLALATTVSASPTMSDCNKSIAAGVVSPASDAQARYVPETSQITELFNSHLAAIGAEILKPPAEFFTYSPHLGAKTLPPVPAALFMVLTGFLCVSLVKDRKVWLAALAGLLWVGQAGIQVIPQLAAHISSTKHIHQKSSANIALLHRVEDLCRLRSDIEGTQYIGLLHHLAGIPNSISCVGSHVPLVAHKSSARTKSNLAVPQFAITHFSSLLIHSAICLAPRAEQYICFSPAFIFENLPRGPPKSAYGQQPSVHGGLIAQGPSNRRLM